MTHPADAPMRAAPHVLTLAAGGCRMTVQQLAALVLVAGAPGQLSVTHVARLLDLPLMVAWRALNALRLLGYLDHAPHPTDARLRSFTATTEGRHYLARVETQGATHRRARRWPHAAALPAGFGAGGVA